MATPEPQKLKFKTVDQIGFAVKDADKVIESWSSMFGMGPWSFRDIGGIDGKGRPWKARLAFAPMGDTTIELIQPVEGRIFQSRFLETIGEGVNHLGFYVDDVEGEMAKLIDQGAKLLLKAEGQFAYFETGGPGGVIFELIQRPK